MSPFETYVLRVTEYDFEQDAEKYVPTARETEYLYSTFSVNALSQEHAMSILSDRVGWHIKSVQFIGEDAEINVYSPPDSL
jgi:hypothetical protein